MYIYISYVYIYHIFMYKHMYIYIYLMYIYIYTMFISLLCIYIYTYAQDRHSIFILPGWRLKPPQAFGAAAEGGRVPRKNPQRRTRELQDGQTAAGAAAFGEFSL